MSAAVGLVTAVRVIPGTEGQGEAAASGIPGEIISLVPLILFLLRTLVEIGVDVVKVLKVVRYCILMKDMLL